MELATRLARAARVFAAQRSLPTTMEQVAHLAVEVIAGVDAAGLSIQGDRARNFARNAVVTDSFAGACEALQFRLGEGPAVDPELEGDVVLVEDTGDDQRWPDLTTRIRRMGVRALVACHLRGERTASARLNLYARHPLGAEAKDVAELYAVHAGVAMSCAGTFEHMRVAMTSRAYIGQAVGLVMHRHHLESDLAFRLLAHVSQELNIKLRDLAQIVLETGDPGLTGDLARHAAKKAAARVDELRYRRTSDAAARPVGEVLTEAQQRSQWAAARTVYRLGEAASRGTWRPEKG